MSKFRHQQSRVIVMLLCRCPKSLRSATAEGFLLRYVFLEALIRLVGRYYRERGATQKKHVEQDASLNVEVVKRSLKYFDVLIDDRRVDAVLPSPKARRGCKTERELRNGLVHRWVVSDAEEVIKRFEELQGAMSGLVEALSVRVEGVAT